jgi:enamine deaminase RidA (YjgF/YER057c/UK114 family)
MVFVAGNVGDDASGKIVDPGNFGKQVHRTFSNITTALNAAGATGEDVVRLRLFLIKLLSVVGLNIPKAFDI